MFLEPRPITGMTPFVSHGCPNCTLIELTLVLVDSERRQEYGLLACQRVAISYLMDLYALYRDISGSPNVPPAPIKPVTTLQVDRVVDPREWLHCIQWSRYQQRGKDASLEWFIARPTDAGFYYSLGEDGTLLMPRDNTRLEMLTVNPETVRTIAGQSTMYCNKPTLQVTASC